jgi:flagellar hook-associated protein 1 FlgK
VSYTDNTSNTQHTITLVRVDDQRLAVAKYATTDPNDRVAVSIFRRSDLDRKPAQCRASTTRLQFSSSLPSTLRIVDDGAPTDRRELGHATTTVTTLTGGSAELPFFLDASSSYTGAIRRRLAEHWQPGASRSTPAFGNPSRLW